MFLISLIVLSIYLTLRIYVLPTFAALERQQLFDNQSRAQFALNSELKTLTNLNREYSEWDETYSYMKGENPDYAARNLQAEFFSSLDVNLFILTNQRGDTLWGSYFHSVLGEISIEDVFPVPFDSDRPLVNMTTIGSEGEGLLQTGQGLALVVIKPVVKTDAQGPATGSLLTGYFMDEKKMAELGRRVSVDMQLFEAEPEYLTNHLQGEVNYLSATANLTFEDHSLKVIKPDELGWRDIFFGNNDERHSPDKLHHEVDAITGDDHHDTLVWGSDPAHLRNHVLIADLFDNPAAILQVVTPRNLSITGLSLQRLTLLTTTIATLFIILIAWLFMQRLIVLPIERLKQHMITMRESGNLNLRLEMPRDDEIGTLADEFDGLAENFHTTQLELQETRDQALALAKIKSEFLATMSHEIRTPMNGVLGMTELLKDTELDNRQKIFVRNIQNSGDLLLSVINDILDFSKSESGKLILEPHEFDLRALVEETMDLLAIQAHEKGLELLLYFPQEIEYGFIGDSNRVRQILINLVSNAIKFTQQGEVVVKVSISEAQSGLKEVLFEITDTGIGINLEKQGVIFEEFSQADSSLTRKYGGTGLGLSISTQLVNMMSGEIGLESEPGKGSCFWFKLPLQAVQWTGSEEPSIHALRGLRVLIVDDNQTNREILHEQTTSWGMCNGAAASGLQALADLRQAAANGKPYDLVLLDWHMPEMDGLEVARQIRADNILCKLPVIVLSSAALDKENQASIQASIDQFLTKPVRQSRLFDCLEKLMRQRSEFTQQEQKKQVDTVPETFEANILLVEDNMINQDVARYMLEKIGCDVTLAINGVEALKAIEDSDFDLILMDCHMPEMDGFEATHLIREREAIKQIYTPIIAVTANVLEGVRERCLNVGMDDFVTKPFSQLQLQKILQTWLPN